MSTSEKIGFEPQSLTMWNLLNRIDGELLRLEQRAEGMEEERDEWKAKYFELMNQSKGHLTGWPSHS